MCYVMLSLRESTTLTNQRLRPICLYFDKWGKSTVVGSCADNIGNAAWQTQLLSRVKKSVLHSDELSVGSERDFHIGTPSSYLCAVSFRNISLLTRPLICPVYFLAWCICGTNACRHQKISVAGSNIIAKVGCFHQDKCQVNFDPATDCSVFGLSCESSKFSVKIKKFYHC